MTFVGKNRSVYRLNVRWAKSAPSYEFLWVSLSVYHSWKLIWLMSWQVEWNRWLMNDLCLISWRSNIAFSPEAHRHTLFAVVVSSSPDSSCCDLRRKPDWTISAGLRSVRPLFWSVLDQEKPFHNALSFPPRAQMSHEQTDQLYVFYDRFSWRSQLLWNSK